MKTCKILIFVDVSNVSGSNTGIVYFVVRSWYSGFIFSEKQRKSCEELRTWLKMVPLPDTSTSK